MDAKGKFAKSTCSTSSLGEASGMKALTSLGDIVVNALVAAKAGSTTIVGDIGLSTSCAMSGTITLTTSEAKVYKMTVHGRTDADVNMFVATGATTSGSDPFLLMLGGYRN